MKKQIKTVAITALAFICALLAKVIAPETAAEEPKQTAPEQQSVRPSIVWKDKAQIESSGTVVKVLPDDTQGTKHQRFLLKEKTTGKVLLFAHNTSLAPAIPDLAPGDTIDFCGEYFDNDRGGGIHWTHRDPARRHRGGWLRKNGRVYQ